MLKAKSLAHESAHHAITSTITNSDTLAQSSQSLNGVLMNASMDEGIRVELMTIPPDLAAKWLKRNHINRPLQRRHVVHYVNAIKAGEWDDANGETIIFSDEHDLMDGQHRLTAVVEAKRTIVSLVVFGVSTKKRGSIDTGAKRQLGDYLGMHSMKNARQLASILATLHAYETGELLSRQRGKSFTSYGEADIFCQAHPGIHEACTAAHAVKNILRPSYAGMLYYLFRQKDAALADIWLGTLHDGHLRPGYEVFLVLRERLLRKKMLREKLHDLEVVAYCIKAWRAAREGKTIKIFKWHESEALPEIV